MSYTYTDSDGDKLTIWAVGDDMVNIAATEGESRTLIGIRDEDAPAVALAILEAAGIGTGNYLPGEMRDLDHVAVDALRRWKKEQDTNAERAVEDAKVRAFIAASSGGHVDKSYKITDYDRAEYKRVQEFFQEDK